MTVQLSKSRIDKLQLLSDLFRGRKLEEKEKIVVAEFIYDCIGNRDLNVLIFNKKQDLISGHNIHRDAIFMLILLTHHTRNLTTRHETLLLPEQKLSKEELEIRSKLFDYAISYSIRSLHPVFKQLQDYEITKLHPELQIFHERVNKCVKKEMELRNKPVKKEMLDKLRAKNSLELFGAVEKFVQYWANLKIELTSEINEDPGFDSRLPVK